MAISMLSLVATVTVLAVHHRNDSTPVPKWLKVLAQLKPKTANKVEERSQGVLGMNLKNVYSNSEILNLTLRLGQIP